MNQIDRASIIQAVRTAAAFINAYDGGNLPPPLSNRDRITERRRRDLLVERIIPATRSGGHPVVQVRRGTEMLLTARLSPGWEVADLRIEIVRYAADFAWI